MVYKFVSRLIKMFFISMLIVSCASLELLEKKPEVKFKDISLGGFDFQSIDLDLIYEVSNPYTFEFLLKSISYDLKIDEVKMLNSNLILDRVIPPLQTSPLSMRLHLTYASLGKIFTELLVKKQINAHIDGQVKVGLPKDFSLPQGLDIPFVYDKKLSLTHN
jgi:LEA14-like dessication related protein